jgi:hypothetical protein
MNEERFVTHIEMRSVVVIASRSICNTRSRDPLERYSMTMYTLLSVELIPKNCTMLV